MSRGKSMNSPPIFVWNIKLFLVIGQIPDCSSLPMVICFYEVAVSGLVLEMLYYAEFETVH